MRLPTMCLSAVLLAACAGRTAAPAFTPAFRFPESVEAVDVSTGNRLDAAQFLRRVAGADIVLLGELHDNAVHHEVRGQVIAASAARRPAIVFEQFAETSSPIAAPAEGEDPEGWLDRNGFDRAAWRWPLHRPVVDAATRHGASLWGSGVSREALRSVVRDGESAASPHLRPLLEQAPLDAAAQAALDAELVAGHCGQLPQSMIAGMRAAQTVRDAAMANALARASSEGPAWLIAGNGHVRRDMAVPRLLRVTAPGRSVLAVGFLERSESGAEPEALARAVYDIVVITPRVARPDPCAAFRRRPQDSTPTAAPRPE